MGCTGSKEQKQNKVIEQLMRAEAKEQERRIKLLLLGTGESGKSTLFKQMKLLYTKEKKFRADELEVFKSAVYKNILQDIKMMVLVQETHTDMQTKEGRDAAQKIFELSIPIINTEVAKIIEAAWNDPGMQQTWENRGDIQVQDSLEYFLTKQNLSRISQASYLPTNMDILRTRIRTSGVVQAEFVIDGAEIEMVDVGGQRNERRKWIQAFERVTGVMFVAAISEYNQYLFEDTTKSRQAEAVELFRSELHRDQWQSTPFILFLNKTDLFKEKLVKIPFRVDSGPERRNTDFQGPHIDLSREYNIDGSDSAFEECYSAACNYLQTLYEIQQPKERQTIIYPRFTNSTDSENVKHVMDSCKDMILRKNLHIGGWM